LRRNFLKNQHKNIWRKQMDKLLIAQIPNLWKDFLSEQVCGSFERLEVETETEHKINIDDMFKIDSPNYVSFDTTYMREGTVFTIVDINPDKFIIYFPHEPNFKNNDNTPPHISKKRLDLLLKGRNIFKVA